MKNYKYYFACYQYFATGEGMTDCCAIVVSDTEEKARREFLLKYIIQQPSEKIEEAIEYFNNFLEIYDLSNRNMHDKIKGLLGKYFKNPIVDSILHAAKSDALGEFSFCLHRNYS